MATRILFHSKAPWSSVWTEDSLLIYDRALDRHPASAKWIRRFPRRYGVKSGEALKDLAAFPAHVKKISRLASGLASRRLTIVVAGGGTVGDFGGFVASVFKRGVRLVHVPTTWLAALDSAHGGKTGLNVDGVKNQIGSFYPAAEVHLVKEFLATQPPARAAEAAGEVLKIALLKGGVLARRRWETEGAGTESLWTSLPAAIRGKMSIVGKDPLEKSGVRHLLNLGHTMGHVFETALGLPHGLAVAYGLVFATAFSRARGECGEAAYHRIVSHPLWGTFLPSPLYAKCLAVPPAKIRALLLQDKKRTRGRSLRFVLLKDVGRPVIREIDVDVILREVARQKKLLRRWTER